MPQTTPYVLTHFLFNKILNALSSRNISTSAEEPQKCQLQISFAYAIKHVTMATLPNTTRPASFKRRSTLCGIATQHLHDDDDNDGNFRFKKKKKLIHYVVVIFLLIFLTKQAGV